MTCSSVQPRDRIFVKGYGFLSFAQNMGRNIGKSTRKKLNQKLIDHAKQSATDALKKSSQRAIQKTSETAGDLIGNKIADRITKVSKTSPKNNSETNEKEILSERFIISKLRQKMTDDLQLKKENYWWFKINII